MNLNLLDGEELKEMFSFRDVLQMGPLLSMLALYVFLRVFLLDPLHCIILCFSDRLHSVPYGDDIRGAYQDSENPDVAGDFLYGLCLHAGTGEMQRGERQNSCAK